MNKPKQDLAKNVRVVKLIILTCVAIVTVILIAILYMILAGEQIASKVLPLPPESTVLYQNITNEDQYTSKISIYGINLSLPNSRDWFSQFIVMSPIDEIILDTDTSYEALNHLTYDFPVVYELMLHLRNFPNTDFSYNLYRQCFDVEIFTANAFQESDYMMLLSETDEADYPTVALIQSCWP